MIHEVENRINQPQLIFNEAKLIALTLAPKLLVGYVARGNDRPGLRNRARHNHQHH